MIATQNGHTLVIGQDRNHIIIIDNVTDNAQILTRDEVDASEEDWYDNLCNFFGVPAAAEEAGDVE